MIPIVSKDTTIQDEFKIKEELIKIVGGMHNLDHV